jgi:hypothetical protein
MDKIHETVAVAKLDDGRLIEYDLAFDEDAKWVDIKEYEKLGYKFIGQGVVYSIEGVDQTPTMRGLFYVQSR